MITLEDAQVLSVAVAGVATICALFKMLVRAMREKDAECRKALATATSRLDDADAARSKLQHRVQKLEEHQEGALRGIDTNLSILTRIIAKDRGVVYATPRPFPGQDAAPADEPSTDTIRRHLVARDHNSG